MFIKHPKVITYFMNLFLIRMDKNSPITGNSYLYRYINKIVHPPRTNIQHPLTMDEQ